MIKHNAESWGKMGASGYLIRSYTNGKDHLVLLRSRFQKTGEWLVYADFNGKGVSRGRLEEVLGMMGDSVKWIQPGRGLELSEAAWKVLRG